jgi:hypothetical protein
MDVITQIMQGVSSSKISAQQVAQEKFPFSDQIKEDQIPGLTRAIILKYLSSKCE